MSLPSRRASHSVFFLPRCAIHPALRSLPTRRSSDLLCGDRLTLYATVEGETITSLQFEGEGCAISVASASMMCEDLENHSCPQAKQQLRHFLDLVTGRAQSDRKCVV